MADKIIEFLAYPEFDKGDVVARWASRVTVNMKWVAGVKPGFAEGTADILMAGSSHWIPINATYLEFMEKWQG